MLSTNQKALLPLNLCSTHRLWCLCTACDTGRLAEARTQWSGAGSIASAVPLGKEFWVNTQQAKSPSNNRLVSGSGIFWKHVLWMRFVYICFVVVAATANVVLR
jgi:hypothetical protein